MNESTKNKSISTDLRSRLAPYSRELALIGLTLFIVVLFSILYPYSFCSWDNLNAILRNLAFEGILAIGMMVLLVSGEFDLSVGAMASMIGVVTAWLMKVAGWPVPLAVATGLAIGALAGAMNGVFVAKLRVNALIATLGTMGIFQGIALLVGGPGVTFLPESFSRVGQAELLGLQAPVWLLGALALGAAFCSCQIMRLFPIFFEISGVCVVWTRGLDFFCSFSFSSWVSTFLS